MSTNPELASGELVLKELPELVCFEDMESFLRAIPSIFGVVIPSSVTNVIVSNTQPTDSQTSAVWIRLSNSGTFIGIYIFSNGEWAQIAPTPNAIQWLYGDSDVPPLGYITTDAAGTGYISSSLKSSLKALWIAGSQTPPKYEYYSAIYIGF